MTEQQKTANDLGFSDLMTCMEQGVKRIRREEATYTEFGAHLEPKLRMPVPRGGRGRGAS